MEGRSNLNLPPEKRSLFSSQRNLFLALFFNWFELVRLGLNCAQFVVLTQRVAKLAGVGGMSGRD